MKKVVLFGLFMSSLSLSGSDSAVIISAEQQCANRIKKLVWTWHSDFDQQLPAFKKWYKENPLDIDAIEGEDCLFAGGQGPLGSQLDSVIAGSVSTKTSYRNEKIHAKILAALAYEHRSKKDTTDNPERILVSLIKDFLADELDLHNSQESLIRFFEAGIYNLDAIRVCAENEETIVDYLLRLHKEGYSDAFHILRILKDSTSKVLSQYFVAAMTTSNGAVMFKEYQDKMHVDVNNLGWMNGEFAQIPVDLFFREGRLQVIPSNADSPKK